MNTVNDSVGTLLLSRKDVSTLLTLDECIAVVESAFRQHALGGMPAPKVLGMPSVDGGFHLKTALLTLDSPYFAAKLNGNFFHNRERFDMPNIQGLLILADASNGYPIAVMDSIEITILRTGAATAVAAKYLARPDSRVATICGCGNQGRVQLRALSRVVPVEKAFAFDLSAEQARKFSEELAEELGIEIDVAYDLSAAARKSDICITCTPARKFLLNKEDVLPGTFVAGVGADSEDKQELDPTLMACSKVVPDIREQCAEIGDLHHAIHAGLMRLDDVHGELGEIVAGGKPGRISKEEITIFDSTGTALQDVAAAAAVYERAVKEGRGARFQFQTT
jgi:alanine dehydrogenase